MASYRLSTGAKPSHYDLRIEPDLQKRTFEGQVTIRIEVYETIVSLKLNIHELSIQTTTLQDVSAHEILIASTKTDKSAQTFKILLEDHVPANTSLVLHQSFTGVLGKDGSGFHIPFGPNFMAATNFEPTSARTVFPCFDEPSFKATFSVILVVPKELVCLGNMPIKSTTDSLSQSTRKKVVEFEETPVMSTYLVAFAIGKLEFIETKDFRIPIRVYVPTNYYQLDHCRFGLIIAANAFDILEKMLEVDYPLPKLDILVVPGSTGGMENWGLITLSHESIIIAQDNSAADKVTAMETIAHEMAHQWFGNLVTMDSWDNFWLKEGLSEWAELEIRERMPGNLEPFQDFASSSLQCAFLEDAKEFGHPLEIGIDGTAVAKPSFDDITYKKGCAVLRMLSSYLGSDIFLAGVRLYLRLHAYGNTETDDLWDTMSHVSGLDIGAFMKPWTITAGHPVLTIDEKEPNSSIKQGPFQMQKSKSKEDHTILPTPLRVLTRLGVSGDLLTTKSNLIKLPLDFYVLNAGQTGFYRVSYNLSRLRILCNNLSKQHLSVEDRIGLISNTSALAIYDDSNIRISSLLGLLQHFEDEESYFVWKTIISILSEIQKSLLFERRKIREAFEKFWRHLVRRCLYRKGKFSLDVNLNEQRFKALMFGNSGGDEKVLAAAKLMFERFVTGNEKPINPNLRAEVFKIVLNDGGKKQYVELKSKLKLLRLRNAMISCAH